MQVLSTQYDSLESLQSDVDAYKAEVDAHKLTIGVPFPLPPCNLVGIIVNENHTIEWEEAAPAPEALPDEWGDIWGRLKKEQEEFMLLEEYQRRRKDSYPPIGDQLDALFHAGVFPEAMTASIQAVKELYPKPDPDANPDPDDDFSIL